MNRSRRIVRGQTVQPEKLLLAKLLRRKMTLAERRLWKVRRQQVIAGYVVDFYCNTAKLAIEVDGGVHGEQTNYDELRDGVLARNGVRVVRIVNEAMYDVEAVIEFIKEKIEALRKETSPRGCA